MKLQRGLIRTRYGQIHYRTAGSGDAIMLFHINQQSSALYDELIEVLSPRFRVVAIDYPSHGMSDHVTEQPRVEDYAQAALEVMDALAIDQSCVLGEAIGSAVAAEIAGSNPRRVRCAVLLNCPLTSSKEEISGVVSEVRETRRPADSSGFPLIRDLSFVLGVDADHAPLRPTQSWMDRINLAQIEAGRDRWQASTAFLAYDLRTALQSIKCPTLLLTGEFCRFVSNRTDVATCIENVTSEFVPNARFCMGWERADVIGQRTIEFIDRLDLH